MSERGALPSGEPPRFFDPDRACPHDDFAATVEVCRHAAGDDDPTIVGYSAEIRVRCVACDEPFRWTGIPSMSHPTCSLDETELRAPLRPASADPDFGMGLPGFSVRVIDGCSGGGSCQH